MDRKTYGILNLIVAFVGLAGIAIGIFFTLSKSFSNSSEELADCKGWKGDKDGVDTFNQFVFAIGVGSAVTGVLALISGIMGWVGSLELHGNFILASIGVVAVVIPFASLVVILAFGIGATVDGECASRACEGWKCNKIGCKELGTGTQDCLGWCKSDYEYLCNDLPPYFTSSALIFVVVFLVSVPSCMCGCGAACACPEKFFHYDEMMEAHSHAHDGDEQVYGNQKSLGN